MILIGQFDSSFVRRVGIALRLLGIDFEHRPWSVFGDFDRVRAFNPLGRVPVLVLDESRPQDALLDTHSILDHLDGLVAAGRRLTPQEEPARRQALRVSALASQLADTVVSLFYEKVLHPDPSQTLIRRRETQILTGLKALEAERSARPGPHWFGDRLLNADIAVAASLRHAVDSHPALVDLDHWPALAAHCAALEALPVFQEISQPFIPPA